MTIDSHTDAIIFDMDGTLWDAVDTYASIWNMAFEAEGYNRDITRADLLALIGTPIDDILRHFVDEKDVNRILTTIATLVRTELPRLGGKLYEGVQEGVARLARHYKLFMLSNCDDLELPIFVHYAGLDNYITDTIAYGDTGLPKSDNLRILTQKHNLRKPVYVGDTESDCQEAHKSDIPFVWLSYGFGKTDNYELRFDTFPQLTDFFVKLATKNTTLNPLNDSNL